MPTTTGTKSTKSAKSAKSTKKSRKIVVEKQFSAGRQSFRRNDIIRRPKSISGDLISAEMFLKGLNKALKKKGKFDLFFTIERGAEKRAPLIAGTRLVSGKEPKTITMLLVNAGKLPAITNTQSKPYKRNISDVALEEFCWHVPYPVKLVHC